MCVYKTRKKFNEVLVNKFLLNKKMFDNPATFFSVAINTEHNNTKLFDNDV